MRIAKFSISSKKALGALITSGPVAWLSGLMLVYYPAVLIGLFFIYAKKFKWTWFVVLGGVLVAYLGSRALIYQIAGGSDYRSIAAYYNATVLLTLFLAYAFARGVFKSGGINTRLYVSGLANKVFIFVSGITICSWLVAFFVPSLKKAIDFPTPVGIAIKSSLPGILGTAQRISLTRADWGAGIPIPRSMVMAGFPTSAAMVVAALGFLALYKNVIEGNKIKEGWINILMLVCVAMTLTRTIVVGIIIGYLITNLVKRKTPFRILAVVFMSFAVVFVSSWYFTRQQHAGIKSAVDFRSSSTETRMGSYKKAFDLAMQEGPILGLGVKPRNDDQLKIPVGSHSTLVGMFLKGGLVGEIFALILFFIIPGYWVLMLYLRYMRSRDKECRNIYYKHFILSFRFLLLFFPWLVFEDIDAYVFTSLLVFCVFAMIFHSDGQSGSRGLISDGRSR